MNFSKSSYYYTPKEKSREYRLWNTEIRDEIERLHTEFPGYGWRRIKVHFSKLGIVVNHKRIKRIQRENSLYPIVFRSFRVKTTDSNHNHRIYPNLKKGTVLNGMNQVWIADITYIRLNLEFVYLAVILDNYSRKAIGWALSRSLHHSLCVEALKAAIEKRTPPKGVIHHSDRGVQYACEHYVEILNAHGFQISMSAKGYCYDNAHLESFFKTLKYEQVHLCNYETLEEVTKNLPSFIEDVYNEKRFHSALNYKSPNEFEEWVVKQKQENRPSLTLS
jgi:putative transposase